MTIETPPNRPLRADARRNRSKIVAAARAVFAESGSEAQMDDVAARAGVGVGTVYRHFPTKTALRAALVREHFEAKLEEAEVVAAADGDAFELLAGYLRGQCETCAADAALRDAMLDGDEAVWEPSAHLRTALLGHLEPLAERAKADGTLREDFTVADVPVMMCGVSAVMARTGPGADWRRHLELLLDGLRAR